MTAGYQENQGPLAGYRILEFGTNVSVPFAAMLLGDQGADVIKIETPGGDQTRGAGCFRSGVDAMATYFLNVNRNKRCIVLDLKSPDGLEAVRRLAATADVVVQNFRPGVAARLGIDYESLKAIRPDLIYVSVDGLGSEGKDAKRRVYDIVVQGISGYAAVQAPPETGIPTMMNTTITDKITSMNIWQAVTAALLVRERTGKGQHVEISMLDAALAFLWPDTMGSATLVGEGAVNSAGPAEVKFVHPTQDSHIVIGFFGPDEWAGLCRVIGMPELIEDPRFRTLKDRLGNIHDMNDILSKAFLSRPTAEWVAMLEKVDAVYAPVNRPEDLMDDPTIRQRGLLPEYDHPVVGRYRQPVHAVRFGETPASIRRHAPALGADTEEVLAEIGMAKVTAE